MKYALITTVQHNPGDEFIRLGQEHVLRQLDADATFTYVHKHDPRTVFEGFERRRRNPHRLVGPWLYRLKSLGADPAANKLDRSDVVVFAGTPFVFRQATRLFPSTSANAEWVGATWRRLMDDLVDKPVLNLAAGTSVDNPARLQAILADRKVAAFLDAAVRRAALTTARDPNTVQILARLGHAVPLLPCSSLLAARGAGIAAEAPRYVAFNIMPAGVHRARGNALDAQRWQHTIQAVLPEVEKRHPVMLVCHAEDEAEVARRWFPGRPIVCSRDGRTLLRAYAAARYGVCNRVHGAAAVAAMGRPALAIGGDSRADLVRQFGLPTLDARTASAEEILHAIEQLDANYSAWCDQLHELADRLEGQYRELIAAALARGGARRVPSLSSALCAQSGHEVPHGD